MNTIQQTIIETLKDASWLTFFIVFWAGAGLSLSSCTLIRVPIVVSYVSGMASSRRRAIALTVFFVAGLILSYTILGIIFGTAATVMGKMIARSRYFYYCLGGLALFVGLQLAGLVRWVPAGLRVPVHFSPKKLGLLGAFFFGVIFAIFEAPTCPCCGPVLFIIASLTFVTGKIAWAILIFFTYALGQSFPILLIGSFTSIVKYISPRVERMESWIKLLGGNVLLILAIYFFTIG